MSEAKSEKPSAQHMHTLYRLDPETGRIYWRIKKNGRRPGDEAFKSKRPNGSRQGRLPGGQICNAAVVAFVLTHGRWPVSVGHKNGDLGDNRPGNLEELARRGQHRRAVRSDSVSGVVGVQKRGQSYCARARVAGELRQIGVFDNIEDAAKAVESAQREERRRRAV